MNIDLIITQLRTWTPVFKLVGGTADFTGAENSNAALPAAYVMPTAIDAAENQVMNGVNQILTNHFTVVLLLDNRLSDDGKTKSFESTRTFKQATQQAFNFYTQTIHKALLNWSIPDPNAISVVAFEGGDLEVSQLGTARFAFNMDYSYESQITEQDGFNAAGTPITDIDLVDYLHDFQVSIT